MPKKKLYLVVDTETATLPFVNEIALNAKQRQKISIAKPLVYNIGWTVVDKKGNVYSKQNFLVQETFFVPTIFNTAYYKDKRPKYIELLNQNAIKVNTWYNIMKIFAADLDKVDISTAFNATFDFKKAIPFTCKYIYHLYKSDYQEWEDKQRNKCQAILNGGKVKNEDFLIPTFTLFKKDYPITDLWSIACQKLLNTNRYKEFCCENELLSASANYFSTSAETVYKFLMLDETFQEQHTALNDAEIEAQILLRILKKGALNQNITAFPFRELGTTTQFARENKQYIDLVISKLCDYLENITADSPYASSIMNNIASLKGTK